MRKEEKQKAKEKRNAIPDGHSGQKKKEKNLNKILANQIQQYIKRIKNFPCGSAGKEFPCHMGDLGSIPGLGRSLEMGKATHSSILA